MVVRIGLRTVVGQVAAAIVVHRSAADARVLVLAVGDVGVGEGRVGAVVVDAVRIGPLDDLVCRVVVERQGLVAAGPHQVVDQGIQPARGVERVARDDVVATRQAGAPAPIVVAEGRQDTDAGGGALLADPGQVAGDVVVVVDIKITCARVVHSRALSGGVVLVRYLALGPGFAGQPAQRVVDVGNQVSVRLRGGQYTADVVVGIAHVRVRAGGVHQLLAAQVVVVEGETLAVPQPDHVHPTVGVVSRALVVRAVVRPGVGFVRIEDERWPPESIVAVLADIPLGVGDGIHLAPAGVGQGLGILDQRRADARLDLDHVVVVVVQGLGNPVA